MKRDEILHLMNEIMQRQGKQSVDSESLSLREANFRSLDFSELALRVEKKLGKELNFDAATLRAIQTVKDILDFFERQN